MLISSDYILSSGFSTKLGIVKATNKLLMECDFSELTVDLICHSAGVGRSTFYRSFKDKFDIINWYDDVAAEQGLLRIGRSLDWENGRLQTFAAWMDVKALASSAAKQKGYESLSRFTVRKRRQYYIDTIVCFYKMELTELLSFQAESYAYTECGIIMDWFRNDFDRSPEAISKLLDTVVPRELYTLFNTRKGSWQ